MGRELRRWSLVAVWAVALPLVARGASAGERPAGIPAEAIKVYGGIAARKGGRRRPRAATLTTRQKKTYNLVLDPKGRSLVQVMHRERAEVWGLVSAKGGAEWLRVLDYTDRRLTAGHELWRRMRCNACVVLPAMVNAGTPKKLHGAAAVTGKYHSFREMFTAWARDAKSLWLATDNRVLQVDLASRRLVRSFGLAEGLPDRRVYGLASDGKTLWIAHRGGVAALKITAGEIVNPPEFESDYARVHLDPGGAWVMTTKATFRLKAPGEKMEKHPALPSAWRISQAVRKGLWIPHWDRRTSHFAASPASIGGRLYVSTYGSIHGLSGGKWKAVASRSWLPAAAGGRLWFLNAEGLGEHDPATGRTETHRLPEECRGRCLKLLATDAAVWVAAYHAPAAKGSAPTGGGLARFDMAKRQWRGWTRINGGKADRVSCMAAADGAVWVVTLDGKYTTKSAHPGMTTTRKSVFVTSGMRLHRFETGTGKWASWPLALNELEKRLICGQDGRRGMDGIFPERVEEISVGPRRIFGVTRLVTKKYFGGYWPCINGLARLAGGEWKAGLEHAPAELRLQGEQPLVLNISHGEFDRIGSRLKDQHWEAVAQDLILGMFVHGGTHWAVTDGCAAFFDGAAGKWRRAVETRYRWYWRATAALEDGGWLYIGSDRGLIGRLELKTAKFEYLATLKGRCVTRFARDKKGALLASTEPAPLGQLPTFLKGKLKPMDAVAAKFDGKTWSAAGAADVPAAPGAPKWLFRKLERTSHLDKTHGNWLCERVPGQAQLKPHFYVKEVFFPLFLCEGGGGRRLWISTYTGLLRLDLPEKKSVK
jgi:hypothetical protein